MKDKVKQYALNFVDTKLNFAEDNLRRASSAFAGLLDEKMQEEYGESGKTRHEILKEYREEVDFWRKEREVVAE